MGRITRNQWLMEMAQLAAERGTCSRLHVGVVISREGRVITMGYNGAPAGMPHCEHSVTPKLDTSQPMAWVIGDNEELTWEPQSGKLMAAPPDTRIEYLEKGCEVAVHAEQNAIAFAAKFGLALDGADLHCTDAPCLNCAKNIINSGIKRVFYNRPYRLTDGVDLLRAAGLEVIDFSAWS